MLMVATTEGMLHGVHGHTTHARPLVALGLLTRKHKSGPAQLSDTFENFRKTICFVALRIRTSKEVNK